MRIDIGICAFKRLAILDTLDSIAAQNLPADTSLRVIVAENDEAPTLRDRIEGHAAAIGLDLLYVHAPAKNISIARNACLEAARGEALIYIDDDEIAEPDWAARMVEHWQATGAGVVFGPVHAIYPPEAPDWMRENDFHSAYAVRNNGVVETGFSGNALLDRSDARVRDARFDLAFGRTGGEDVDFFFRLSRAGVVMESADRAVVREGVAPDRLSFAWLMRRRHRVGALYGHCAAPENAARRIGIMARSAIKAGYCGLRGLLAAANRTRSSFWFIRSAFHAGVVSGCFRQPRNAAYG